MFHDKLNGVCRLGAMLALASVILLGPIVCSAQSNQIPQPKTAFDNTDLSNFIPDKPKPEQSALSLKKFGVYREQGYTDEQIFAALAEKDKRLNTYLEQGYTASQVLAAMESQNVSASGNTGTPPDKNSKIRANLFDQFDNPQTPDKKISWDSLSDTPPKPEKSSSAKAGIDYNADRTIPSRSIMGSTGIVVFWFLLILGLTGYLKMRSHEKATISQTTPLPKDGLIGIHGWLRFFVISLGILGPAFSLARLAGSFQDDESNYAVLLNSAEWATYKTAVWLTLAVFSSFSIYTALQLRFIWKPTSVTLAKIALASWPIATLMIGFVIPGMVFPNLSSTPAPQFFASLFWSTFPAVFWIVYLSKSKRGVPPVSPHEIG